jgi:hypothetical protein
VRHSGVRSMAVSECAPVICFRSIAGVQEQSVPLTLASLVGVRHQIDKNVIYLFLWLFRQTASLMRPSVVC